MKMYTNESQTAKLIELGFEKPRLLYFGNNTIGNYAYTIGELIEMLPKYITHGNRGFISNLSIAPYVQGWKVAYTHNYIMLDSELVDALCSMLTILKRQGTL